MALYHLNSNFFTRANGDNAVAAVAYRFGEKLAHEDILLCSIEAEHAETLEQGNISAELKRDLERKYLFKAKIEDWDNLKATPESRKELYQQLQAQFEKSDTPLSDNVVLSAHKDQSSWTLRDKTKRQNYIIERDTENPDEFNISRDNGISLSKHASIEESESGWTINDGKKTYHIKQGKGDELKVYGDKIYDYSGRKDVVFTNILTPENAPESVKDPQSLANMIEKSEMNKDGSIRKKAQLAQELDIALPREHDLEQNINLIQKYAQVFVDRGMIAAIAIHNDAENHNPHAHVILTMRDISEDGFGNKNREWNDGRAGMRKKQLNEMREAWQDVHNGSVDEADHIDHRTLAEQGIHDHVAGKHLGKEASAMQESERAALLQHRTEHYNDVDKFWKASNLSVNEDILLREMQAGYENNQPTLDRADKFPEIYQIYPEPEQGEGVEQGR